MYINHIGASPLILLKRPGRKAEKHAMIKPSVRQAVTAGKTELVL